ncbi:MAG: OmpA family protein [Woeseiaceae bacterium]|nr:OmpA family protein [Woeseiaceae bacterium]
MGDSIPGEGELMVCLIRKLIILAAGCALLPAVAGAQTLQNSASGELNGVTLDQAQATVTLNRLPVVDATNSSVTVDPPVVAADGVAFSTITVTMRDANDQPLPGRTVSLASSRGALDVITQPLGATDANGVTTGEIRSVNSGVTQVSATDVVESVLLDDQPDVGFSRGIVLQLTKTVRPERAMIGDLVTYTIEIQNTTDSTVGDVRISDSAAPVLAYVPGTANLDGVAIPDPSGSIPQFFDVGDVPPLVDLNGNGVADPGESGFMVLTYSMVVGAGARPGEYSNVAIAVDVCDVCAASPPASALLEITSDPLFDLGTIIGKVFRDFDRDGFQDAGESGIGGAMVALDNGVYALTDMHGRFHFPAIEPGQRMVKLNVASIAGNARATGRDRQVLSVTPGLLAKANFGVEYDVDTEGIGSDAVYGIRIDTDAELLPDRITGSAGDLSLVVNGVQIGFADASVELGNVDANSIVHMGEGGSIEPMRFRVGGTLVGRHTDAWTLRVWHDEDDNVKSIRGRGEMPPAIDWPDTGEIVQLLMPGQVYFYQLEAQLGAARITSSRRMFGVNRATSISLELRGGAFASGSHELTDQARDLLSGAAKIMHEHPDEKIFINGHTDAVGSRESNLALSKARANAAFEYLVAEHELAAERFVVNGYGEDRPIASNQTETGRELNRRVEIVGELTSVERARLYETRTNELLVAMNGIELDIDEHGQFSQTLDGGTSETVDLHMIDPVGQSIETSVRLPRLDLQIAADTAYQPYAEDDPRRSAPSSEVVDSEYAYRLSGRTDAGNVVTLDNEQLTVAADGTFDIPLRLQSGSNRYVVSTRNPAGLTRYANLHFAVTTRVDGEPVVAVAPVPTMILRLPPKGIPMRHENLVVQGFTSPGNAITVNEELVEVDDHGRFIADVALRPGANDIVVGVTDPQGHSGEFRRKVDYAPDSMFIMALADGKISQIKRSGNLAAAGAQSASETLTEGRVALYMKGKVLGKYLITAAFDSGQKEIGELFSDLDAIENDRLITNIDPDTVYPVYGDDSQLVYDADTQGKLYLALDGEQLDAIVGNYALSFTDTELTAYQRTLYGARARYESKAKTSDNRTKTQAEAFVARIDQAPVRDEIAATGGSLYFLSHTEIIEGSEQVSLLVHDQHTGLLLQRLAQQRNTDYDIKYREGRIWFRRPVSSVIDDSGLIGSNVLAGHPITIRVDYETPVDGLEASVSGARFRQLFGDGGFGIGGTVIEDDRISSEYSLSGVDAELRFRGTRIVAEYAQSTGSDSLVFRSEDGGLQFAPVTSGPVQEGSAYKIAAEFDAGEWFGRPNQLLGNAYYRRLTDDFFSNGALSAGGQRQAGAALTYKHDNRNTFLMRIDDMQADNNASSMQSSLHWRHQRQKLSLEGEFQQRSFSDPNQDAAITALRAEYAWSEQISTSLEHLEAFSGDVESQSAAEVEYAPNDDLRVSARLVTSDTGEAFQGGASWDSPLGRLYAEQTLAGDGTRTGNAGERTLVGAEAPFGAGGTLYTEYQWDHSGQQRGLRSIAGMRRDWRMTKGLSLLASAEQTILEGAAGGSNEQNAFVGGLSYKQNGIKFSSRNEWRRQQGDSDIAQFASFNYGEIRLPSGFTLLGEYRLSNTDNRLQPELSTDFEEASLGLALRPIEHDRWNLLLKVTRLNSEATPGQAEAQFDTSTADLISADWSYQLTPRIEWVGKQAFKKKLTELDPAFEFETNTSLSIQRLNVKIPLDLSFGVEYRLLRQEEAADQRSGMLGELMWNGMEHIGIGVGYNFTDFSSDLRSVSDYSEHGWFLRLQGLY